MKATVLYSSQCHLGEGPLWNAETRSCFWVDITKGILYQYNWPDASIKTWQFNQHISLVLQSNNDDLLISLDTSLAKFNPVSGQLTWLLDIEKDNDNRCNDASCDSRGRLWVGTMHKKHIAGEGSLYCVDENSHLDKKIGNTTISNGIAWSHDNTRLYFIDSAHQVVQSYFYNENTAAVSFEKNAIEIPDSMGTPDGMAIDREGMLWIAHYGGFGVYRWNPFTGKHLDTIDLPVPNVTSCAFAGDYLGQLIITTARENLSNEQLSEYPNSGDLFVATPAVSGVSAFRCNL